DALASTDSMTGLPNRAAFEAHYQRFAALTQRRRGSSVLALVDLDHFKKVNDRYGHQYGDGVLVEFALVLSEFARRPGDAAARLLIEKGATPSHLRSTDLVAARACSEAEFAETFPDFPTFQRELCSLLFADSREAVIDATSGMRNGIGQLTAAFLAYLEYNLQ